MREYVVYILRCADKSYYTGITNDLSRRLQQHYDGGEPSCYTFKRRPLELVHIEKFQSVLDAIAREKQIKNWSRKKKEALIRYDEKALALLAKCQNESHYRNRSK